MRWTCFVRDDENIKRLVRVSAILRASMDAAVNGGVAYDFGQETIITPSAMTVLNRIGFEDPADRIVIGMIRDACQKVDARCGGMADLTVPFILDVIDSLVSLMATGSSARKLNERLEADVARTIMSLRAHATRAKLADAKALIRRRDRWKRSASIVTEAMRMAGTNGRVHVNKAVGAPRTTIELSSGYAFALEAVISMNSVQPWKHSSARCLVIDGIIESVAEIHGIFDTAHRTNEPLALFARGFNKEVLSTITANRIRKTLNVHPLKVAFDARNANTLKDIGVACGCDVVSSLKGELISTIEWDSVPIVESISVLGPNVTVMNRSVARGVAAHTANLCKLRDEAQFDELKQVYDDRIRSLTGVRVDVRVAGSPRESQALAESIDAGLKQAKCVLSHGLIETRDIETSGLLEGPVNELIRMYENERAPALAIARVVRDGAAAAANLCLAAGMVVSD